MQQSSAVSVAAAVFLAAGVRLTLVILNEPKKERKSEREHTIFECKKDCLGFGGEEALAGAHYCPARLLKTATDV